MMDVVAKLRPQLGMLQEVRPCVYAKNLKTTDSDGFDPDSFSLIADGNAASIVGALYRLGYEVALPHANGQFPFYNLVFFTRDEWHYVEATPPRVVYYSFCKDDPRRFYVFVVVLRHATTGLTIAILNTHFPLPLEEKMSCAAELNALARDIAASGEVDTVIAGGDTNIFHDHGGTEQEAILTEGAERYLTETLRVDLSWESVAFGMQPRYVDECDAPVGTYIGYDYDRVKMWYDVAVCDPSGEAKGNKLDALMLFAGRKRCLDAVTRPVTFPWRYQIDPGHLSGMCWTARNSGSSADVLPPPSDHVAIHAELLFESGAAL
jgi:hypothetical protein